MSKRISRATLLKGTAGLAIAGLSGKLLVDALMTQKKVPVRMLGPSMNVGHKVRDGRYNTESAGAAATHEVPMVGVTHHSVHDRTQSPGGDRHRITDTTIAIIGGGIAGLSAGWWLKRKGFNDFKIYELENHVGGNSSSGKNSVSAFPWGAHYVPLANPESEYVRTLFEELGIIQGHDAQGQPIYSDLYLCHEPQERLLKDGQFEEGFVPRRGLQAADKEQIARFFGTIREFRGSVGSDGKPAFAIPLDLSSEDERFRKLDNISMADWLQEERFTSKPLLWYVNYCCRDDYGSTVENVSAWAGIHYFSGRRGTAANAEMNSVVTWPEGNGFLVNALRDKLAEHIETGAPAIRVAQSGGHVVTSFVSTADGKPFTVQSAHAIFAAPRFIAKHVVEGVENDYPAALAYAPWMVANVTVNHVPGSRGVGLCWDNVSYSSKSLGYVVATHQNISTREAATVLTYYYPLSSTDPVSARKEMLSTSAEDWSERIIADLDKMNPGIREQMVSIDLWPWGHGMVRPSVGYVWGEARKKMLEPIGNICFAHTDMSGISNFEEAQYRGVQSAQHVLARLGVT